MLCSSVPLERHGASVREISKTMDQLLDCKWRKKNAKQLQAYRTRGSKAVHCELGHQPSLLQLQKISLSQLKEITRVTSCTLHSITHAVFTKKYWDDEGKEFTTDYFELLSLHWRNIKRNCDHPFHSQGNRSPARVSNQVPPDQKARTPDDDPRLLVTNDDKTGNWLQKMRDVSTVSEEINR